MTRNQIVTITRTAGVALVIGLGVLLGLRVQARASEESLESEFRQKVGPLDPAAYASAVVPDDENAAIWLRAAAAALSLSKGDKDLHAELSLCAADRWTLEQQRAIERTIARNAPALALAERASTMQRSSYLLSGSDATSGRYHNWLIDIIWLARFIDARARLAAERGDWVTYRSGVVELACIGASLERESPLIAQLIGVASERMMFDVILAGVSSPKANRTALLGLDATVPTVDLAAAWTRALGALGAGVHSGTLDIRDMFDAGSTNITMSVPTPEEYLRIVLGLEGLAAKPMGRDPALADRLEKTKQLKDGRPVADMLAGSLVRYQSVLSLRRLARIALALRLAALESGGYPTDLATWPDASLSDPLTGGRISYERRSDGSAVLSVPGAEQLFNKVNELKTTIPFTWTLPAPAR